MNLFRLTLIIPILGAALFGLYFRPAHQIPKEQLVKKVLEYPMESIVERCKKEHQYTNDDMMILEKELKRYFLLCMLNETKEIKCGMYSRDVDHLWHTFLLFTKDYERFCLSTAGSMIHHVPEIETQQKRTKEQRDQIAQQYRLFIETYEKTFNEEIHPIWLLDQIEKLNI